MYMQSDQKYQQKSYKYCSKIQSNKLLLEINDGVTYRGQIQATPYFDLHELKSIFEKGDFQILTKTTSKIVIKLMVIKLEMISEQTQLIESLKEKILQLQERLKKQSLWEDEDLESKDPFDINYIYKFTSVSSAFSAIITYVNSSNLFFFAAGTNYNISYTNRKATNAGHVVSRIQKKKL